MSPRARYRTFTICLVAISIAAGGHITILLGGDGSMGTRVGLGIELLALITTVIYLWSFRVFPKDEAPHRSSKNVPPSSPVPSRSDH